LLVESHPSATPKVPSEAEGLRQTLDEVITLRIFTITR
jgi:hypothetical protein